MSMLKTLNDLDKANWRKEENWGAVRVSDGTWGLRFSLEKLSEKEREEFKNELERLNINFRERTATQPGPNVSAGDLTIRILDPNSLNKLKSSVFIKEDPDAWIDEFWAKYDTRIKNKELEYMSPWDAFINRLKSADFMGEKISDEQAMKMFSKAFNRAKNSSFTDPKGNSLKASEWTDKKDGTGLLTHMLLLGRNNIAKRLINELYADVKQTNKNGFTPLHAAAQKGSMEMCELLLERFNGANPLAKTKDFGSMPYKLAEEKGHKEVADYLLKKAKDKGLQIGLKMGYVER